MVAPNLFHPMYSTDTYSRGFTGLRVYMVATNLFHPINTTDIYLGGFTGLQVYILTSYFSWEICSQYVPQVYRFTGLHA